MYNNNHLFLLLLGFLCPSVWLMGQSFTTPFERDENYSASYQEAIAFYEKLSAQYPLQLRMQAHGNTDAGFPLHTIVVDKHGHFSSTAAREAGKAVVMVNNAIHPGEPCGVDASMMLVRNLVDGTLNSDLLDRAVLVVIPFYNIGGGLNRGSYSRANQNGPQAYGFRGNVKNLDLNRDFIKCDTRNAQTFNQIYQQWQPHIFIDNHTSNGADYQYTLTLIPTQHNKLQAPLANYLQERMLPYLFREMAQKNWEMTPYVYSRGTPDRGIAGFLDLPRYSSGYAALHHALSFMPETHMLKPFRNRVWSIYHFMVTTLELVKQEHAEILQARQQAEQACREQSSFALNWRLDNSKADTVLFKGYTAKYKPSAISGQERLYYDRSEPWEKKIPHFNYYQATVEIQKPVAYIIPQAYHQVIERLQWNGVVIHRLREDIELELPSYYIEDYETSRSPYEGHYLHSQVQLRTEKMKRRFLRGDAVVFVNQNSNRYIVETLEPQGADSFFAWNFFDGILMQKEGYSSYVFEDLARNYLDQHPELQEQLQERVAEDSSFAQSGRAQLDFVYKNSPYYEFTHNLYPIARLESRIDLPLEN